MAQTILVPVDLDQADVIKSLFETAKTQAHTPDTTIHLLTVLPNLYPHVTLDYIDEQVAKAEERLRNIAEKRLGKACHWQAQALIGPVARTIIRVADEQAADLIIVASHNPIFSDVVFGSVADQIVRRARHSVLVVRQPRSIDATGAVPARAQGSERKTQA